MAQQNKVFLNIGRHWGKTPPTCYIQILDSAYKCIVEIEVSSDSLMQALIGRVDVTGKRVS